MGTVLGTCEMTPKTFQAFGSAMIPFFGFNFYYSFVDPWIAPLLMLSDFINNVAMCLMALRGASLLDGNEN